MLENKKRAKSFKDLALVSACVQWRLSENIKILLKYQIDMVEAAGIEQFVQPIEIRRFIFSVISKYPELIPLKCWMS